MKAVSHILKNKFNVVAWIVLGVNCVVMLPLLLSGQGSSLFGAVVLSMALISGLVLYLAGIHRFNRVLSKKMIAYLMQQGFTPTQQMKDMRIFMIQYLGMGLILPTIGVFFISDFKIMVNCILVITFGLLLLYNYAFVITYGKRPYIVEKALGIVINIHVILFVFPSMEKYWDITGIIFLGGMLILLLCVLIERFKIPKRLETQDLV